MQKHPCTKISSIPLSCFDLVPVHIMVLDNTGKLIYANPTCKKLLNLVQVNPCPTLDSLIVPEDQPRIIKDLLQAYRGNPRVKIPYVLLSRKNKRIKAAITLVPVPNINQIVKHVIVIVYDEK